MQLGLPFNMPAHSLQRAQYVNGLAELPASTRKPLFNATARLVADYYNRPTTKEVPWFPYNFHAGNYFNEETGYSPLDETTAELLEEHCTPLPTWVFSGNVTTTEIVLIFCLVALILIYFNGEMPTVIVNICIVIASKVHLLLTSPRFPAEAFGLDALRAWVKRQIKVFEGAGVSLQQLRIKNPGQGQAWTAANVWAHVQVSKESRPC